MPGPPFMDVSVARSIAWKTSFSPPPMNVSAPGPPISRSSPPPPISWSSFPPPFSRSSAAFPSIRSSPAPPSRTSLSALPGSASRCRLPREWSAPPGRRGLRRTAAPVDVVVAAEGVELERERRRDGGALSVHEDHVRVAVAVEADALDAGSCVVVALREEENDLVGVAEGGVDLDLGVRAVVGLAPGSNGRRRWSGIGRSPEPSCPAIRMVSVLTFVSACLAAGRRRTRSLPRRPRASPRPRAQ